MLRYFGLASILTARVELRLPKEITITNPSEFQNTYTAARDRFRHLAQTTGGTIGFVAHPDARQDGADIYGIDTAWFGPRDASNLLVMISGTHGPELLAGSAMQNLWMEEFGPKRASYTAVFLVHGANPYGCAKIRRTTENNVDLNRNFIDFDALPAGSALSERVQQALCRGGTKGPQARRTLIALLWLGWCHGVGHVSNQITAGQYWRPDGVGFGGTRPEWAHQELCALWRCHLSRAKRVAIIDWHTGIGDYGAPSFLCFDAPQMPAFERATSWWGDAVAQSGAHYKAGTRPSYQGLLIGAVQDIAHEFGAETTAAVIEFGTYANMKMLEGLVLDRWLQCAASNASDDIKLKRQQTLMRLFCPADPRWRQSVLSEGRKIIAQTVAGLQNWDEDT